MEFIFTLARWLGRLTFVFLDGGGLGTPWYSDAVDQLLFMVVGGYVIMCLIFLECRGEVSK